jgi:hypothetical protein
MTIELIVKAGTDAKPGQRSTFEKLASRDPQASPRGLSRRLANARLLPFSTKRGVGGSGRFRARSILSRQPFLAAGQ